MAIKRDVGQVTFYPYKKGETEQVLAMLKRGGGGGHNML